jgi:hypothetical protein
VFCPGSLWQSSFRWGRKIYKFLQSHSKQRVLVQHNGGRNFCFFPAHNTRLPTTRYRQFDTIRMSAVPWRDPLAGIIIPPHPTPSSTILCSALSDPAEYYDQIEQADKLFDLYVPSKEDDDTTRILWHAIRNLPKAGSLQLMSEILHVGSNHEKLRQLRDFFVNSVLKPSTYFLVKCILILLLTITLTNSCCNCRENRRTIASVSF